MGVGGTGTTSANHGQGWRFTDITIAPGSTITNAKLTLKKNGAEWVAQNNRWTVIDEDNTPTFSSGNPPGSRAIVSSQIVTDNRSDNVADGADVDFPPAGSGQTTLAAAIQAVIDRVGWSSGNALAVVNNSDQDESADTSFARSGWHTYDGGNPGTLTIDYTPAGGHPTMRRFGGVRYAERVFGAEGVGVY